MSFSNMRPRQSNSNQARFIKIPHKLRTSYWVAFDEDVRQDAQPAVLCLRFLEKDENGDDKHHDYTDVDD